MTAFLAQPISIWTILSTWEKTKLKLMLLNPRMIRKRRRKERRTLIRRKIPFQRKPRPRLRRQTTPVWSRKTTNRWSYWTGRDCWCNTLRIYRLNTTLCSSSERRKVSSNCRNKRPLKKSQFKKKLKSRLSRETIWRVKLTKKKYLPARCLKQRLRLLEIRRKSGRVCACWMMTPSLSSRMLTASN